jgi:hypothetical protein
MRVMEHSAQAVQASVDCSKSTGDTRAFESEIPRTAATRLATMQQAACELKVEEPSKQKLDSIFSMTLILSST